MLPLRPLRCWVSLDTRANRDRDDYRELSLVPRKRNADRIADRIVSHQHLGSKVHHHHTGRDDRAVVGNDEKEDNAEDSFDDEEDSFDMEA